MPRSRRLSCRLHDGRPLRPRLLGELLPQAVQLRAQRRRMPACQTAGHRAACPEGGSDERRPIYISAVYDAALGSRRCPAHARGFDASLKSGTTRGMLSNDQMRGSHLGSQSRAARRAAKLGASPEGQGNDGFVELTTPSSNSAPGSPDRMGHDAAC